MNNFFKKNYISIILVSIAIIVVSFVNYKQAASLKIGTTAPDLAYENPEGKIVKLSSLKGKLVLIDFWASWCGPCRKENPYVVKAYERFKDEKFINGKGFTVYSVSLDRNKNAWVNAIKQDKLSWPYHVSDLKAWGSEPAKIYNINSIPANYLIDKNRKILARNLRGKALEETLEKYLKQ